MWILDFTNHIIVRMLENLFLIIIFQEENTEHLFVQETFFLYICKYNLSIVRNIHRADINIRFFKFRHKFLLHCLISKISIVHCFTHSLIHLNQIFLLMRHIISSKKPRINNEN